MSLGMDLSRRYWLECGLPVFSRHDPALFQRMAVGLVGEGSECFGFDDDFSRDHDWGPGFCVWLDPDDYASRGEELKALYASLTPSFDGFEVKHHPERVGIFDHEQFFRRYLGRMPRSMTDWLILPEYALSVCTNGSIFHDPSDVFTKEQQFLSTIPQPVRQKKLAARCVTMLQAGQYNLPRCRKRGDILAAQLALNEFLLAAGSAMMLLNHRWTPFYKWLPASLRLLPEPARLLERKLSLLHGVTNGADQDMAVDACCTLIADELRRQGLSALPGNDMQQLGLDIQMHINDDCLRNLPVLLG